MKIQEVSYTRVVLNLADETRKLLDMVDEKASDLNEKGGIDAFAEIHMGGGLYLTMQLTCTLNRREQTETAPKDQLPN